MKTAPILHYPSILRGISERIRRKSSFAADVAVFAGLLAILYALFASGRIWFAPFTPVANISSSPRALPLYAAYSLVRIAIAYVLSLLFALGYGLAAAKSERTAKILLPLPHRRKKTATALPDSVRPHLSGPPPSCWPCCCIS